MPIKKSLNQWIFTARCKEDSPGIVADITTSLHSHGFFIEEAAQYGDAETNQFFMRLQLRNDKNVLASDLAKNLKSAEDEFGLEWKLSNMKDRPKVLIMVSKFEHCLSDLIYRHRIGELNADITAIVSNHETLRHLADDAGIPFHHIPITKATKAEAEAKLEALIKETSSDLIVLARYMQILSSEMCAKYPSRIINIHHSFLPSFKGAKPYHRAHARGVKLIGATAHYVTSDLDEGPIIEQSVERVDHSKTAEALVILGRDVERRALAKAVIMHLDQRVFLNGIRTIVFS